ncbi:MAG: trimethylamine methyltransferase family protein [Bacillota bacterium]
MTNLLMNDKTFKSPHFSYMSEAQCQKIHWASLEILERVGVLLYSREAIELLASAGVDVDGNLVRIRSGLVEKALVTVPKRVALFNRDGELAMPVEGHQVFFGPGSDCLHILDHHTSQRRKPKIQDVVEGVTLCDGLPEIDFVMSMVLPADVDMTLADRYQMEVLLSYTKKPILFVTYEYEGCVDVVEMAQIVAGGEDSLRRRPNVVGYVNVTTGLRHNEEALQKLLFLADKGLPAIYAPDVCSGVTGPVTVPGSVALTLAGVLAGIVISQLKREGAPIIIPGWGGAPMDLRTTVAPYCQPDARSMMVAMGHYYQLPVFSIGGASEAKTADQQAAAEAALTLMAESMSGGGIVHDVGYLESGLTYSFQMLAICTEIIRWIKTYAKELEVNDETLAMDLINEIAHKEQYIHLDHTFRNFRQHYYPDLFERGIYDNWVAQGSKTLGQRAAERVDEVLGKHRPDILDERLRAELNLIVNRAVAKARK